jgi:hypothetical protein
MRILLQMFKHEVIHSLYLEGDPLGFEPKFTAEFARIGVRILVGGISCLRLTRQKEKDRLERRCAGNLSNLQLQPLATHLVTDWAIDTPQVKSFPIGLGGLVKIWHGFVSAVSTSLLLLVGTPALADNSTVYGKPAESNQALVALSNDTPIGEELSTLSSLCVEVVEDLTAGPNRN